VKVIVEIHLTTVKATNSVLKKIHLTTVKATNSVLKNILFRIQHVFVQS
jgi:hypothetical protein